MKLINSHTNTTSIHQVLSLSPHNPNPSTPYSPLEPSPFLSNLYFPPICGHVHPLVTTCIVGMVVAADDDIRMVSSAKRQCFFENEKTMKLFTKYSHSRCLEECAILAAEDSVGCIPWFMPKGTDGVPCFFHNQPKSSSNSL